MNAMLALARSVVRFFTAESAKPHPRRAHRVLTGLETLEAREVPDASLTDSPDPAPTGSNITLTATPAVTAAQVVFFRESNGTPGLQNNDTPVGTDTNGADGWTASVNVGTTPGTFTYYAVPVNASGPVGTPMVTTNTVQGGVEFFLYDADTEQRLVKLTDGMTVDFDEVRDNLSIIAVPTNPAVGSVRLRLSNDDENFNVQADENLEPYALFGDKKKGRDVLGIVDSQGNTLPEGDYTLSGTIFTGKNGSGQQVNTTSINVSFVRGLETAIPNEPADQVYVTADGVEFVRTPDEYFENLPDWPYEPKYVEIDGLRQAYIDEGPADGPVVLLLHGQPSWSYLYRDMIPGLVDAGYRVIAMDHLGMGRSDKPTDVEYYTYEVHTDRLEQFIVELGLEDINLFAQDWGSLVGLHVAGENPDWFASIAVGNGALPVIPAGTEPFPPVLNTDVIVDVPSPFNLIPAQQVPFRDADGELLGQGPAGAFNEGYFGNWMNFAMTGASFKPSDVVEALTWFDIPADEQAAYDAPFPTRAYMAGPRSFPSVINDLPGANDQAWAGLGAYDKPFVTIWGGNDPGNLGGSEVQQQLIDHVPGADGQPHTRLPEASHFLQDDQGEEIARQLIAFYEANGLAPEQPEILTAYLGVLDVRFPKALENVSGSPQARGDEGMPVVFSVQIDASTLDPEDFVITTESGAKTRPSAVTPAPADESDELRTVLLTGPLGSADDLPVSVEIVGSVLSVDGEELRGLTSEVTTNDNGPSLVLALLDPAETTADGETENARIQLTFQGGVSGPFGTRIGFRELRGISIIDANGDAHRPVGFEDLGDNDNHVVIVVPEGVTPVSVEVDAGTFFDPTNQPNPKTSVEVIGTVELGEEPRRTVRNVLGNFFDGRPTSPRDRADEGRLLPAAVRQHLVVGLVKKTISNRLPLFLQPDGDEHRRRTEGPRRTGGGR